jgi:hypothetical protein
MYVYLLVFSVFYIQLRPFLGLRQNDVSRHQETATGYSKIGYFLPSHYFLCIFFDGCQSLRPLCVVTFARV